MIYKVSGILVSDKAKALYQKLTYGTIARQMPDGGEIDAAMRSAIITDDGRVQWSMGCFCAVPLEHERQTVFDKFFTDLEIEPIGGRETYQGRSFMNELEQQFGELDAA